MGHNGVRPKFRARRALRRWPFASFLGVEMARANKPVQLRPVDEGVQPAPVIRLKNRETEHLQKDNDPIRLGAPLGGSEVSQRLDLPTREEVELRTHQPGIETIIATEATNPDHLEQKWGVNASPPLSDSVGMVRAHRPDHQRGGAVVVDPNRKGGGSGRSNPCRYGLCPQQGTTGGTRGPPTHRADRQDADGLLQCHQRGSPRPSGPPPGTGRSTDATVLRRPPGVLQPLEHRQLTPLRSPSTRPCEFLDRLGGLGGRQKAPAHHRNPGIRRTVRIDWETLVCYQPMKWDDYVAQRPAVTPLDFRVYVEPTLLQPRIQRCQTVDVFPALRPGQ